MAGQKGTGAVAGDAIPEAMIDGVRFTHPDKVLWPQQGVTKRELVAYYNQVADRILPHLANRPLTLLRAPAGRQAQCFLQRHAAEGVPAAIKRVPVKEPKGTVDYITVEDRRGLLNLVQLGALELHPWGARFDRLDRPDRLVVDLKPADGVPWPAAQDAALALRDRFAALELESFVMVGGDGGLIVVMPMARRLDWDGALAIAKAVAGQVVETNPKLYTLSELKTQRVGRVFFDVARNARAVTDVAPYSPRALTGATVAVPVTWDELPKLAGPAPFSLTTVPERLRGTGDPWAAVLTQQQSVSAAARRALGV